VIKVRLQLQKTTGGTGPPKYNGFIRSFFVIFREEGLSGLGRGLAPALLREATYSGIRLGLYDQIRAKYILKTDENGRLGEIGKGAEVFDNNFLAPLR
jgi:hypothetical protein